MGCALCRRAAGALEILRIIITNDSNIHVPYIDFEFHLYENLLLNTDFDDLYDIILAPISHGFGM